MSERRPENRLPFDFRPWRSAVVEDLDLALLKMDYAAHLGRDADAGTFPELEPWLAQRDLLRRTEQGWSPNPAAILVYGIDPQSHFPGAIIEFVRHAGVDFEGPVISRKTVTGRLPDQLEALWTQLQANLADVPDAPAGIRTPYVPAYPIEALKELARNLVQHRLYESTHAPGRVAWFDDRIVFTNPGGPFGQANEGEFGTHSDYRNPIVTRLLVELGYVERLGRGIRRVRSELAANRNPPLEVETDGFTTVVVRGRPRDRSSCSTTRAASARPR